MLGLVFSPMNWVSLVISGGVGRGMGVKTTSDQQCHQPPAMPY